MDQSLETEFFRLQAAGISPFIVNERMANFMLAGQTCFGGAFQNVMQQQMQHQALLTTSRSALEERHKDRNINPRPVPRHDMGRTRENEFRPRERNRDQRYSKPPGEYNAYEETYEAPETGYYNNNNNNNATSNMDGNEMEYEAEQPDRTSRPDNSYSSTTTTSSSDRASRDDSRRDRRKDRDGRDGRRRERDRSKERSRDRSRERFRSRERSRERSRDRSKDREREKDYDREREWERDHLGRDPRDWREEIPNQTIMVRGLAAHISEDDLKAEIRKHGLEPKDIRLLRKKDTGTSRGFAFVEFQLLSEAVRWKELTQGTLMFQDQYRATLHYSIPKDISPLERSISRRQDWCCANCGVNNFRRRDFCFKCNVAREDAETETLGEGSHEVSITPSNTLLFRNLDILTTEDNVLAVLGKLTALPIKSLKLAKDALTNTSRGFCFVELHSMSEALQLHDKLANMEFCVDNKPVAVTYARRSSTSFNSTASANAASVALAAAQWTNQVPSDYSQYYSYYPATGTSTQTTPVVTPEVAAAEDTSKKDKNGKAPPVQQATDLGTVTVNSITYAKYPVPDVSQYRFDNSSGYYYDAVTGLYYDANTTYYYNSDTLQYLYWDGEHQTYLPAPIQPTTNPSAAPGSADADKQDADKNKPKDKDKQDKVKIAKKIAKDMERWAKTLNQKKENAKLGVPVTQGAPLLPAGSSSLGSLSAEQFKRTSAAADAGFTVLEKRSTPAERQALLSDIMKDVDEKPDKPALVAAYGDGSDSEPELETTGDRVMEALKAEELRLTDWSKMACLLCKRQFPSKEGLRKHQQLSDLHKQNLNALRKSTLTAEEIEEMEQREQEGGYRDRAKERRQKYGQPDPPQKNKLKDKYLKHLEIKQSTSFEEPTKEGIGSENVGNKMLKAMGWSEGQGLGRSNQGMAGIVQVNRRVATAGLGMKGASYGATATDNYKEAVKKSMQARYNEVD